MTRTRTALTLTGSFLFIVVVMAAGRVLVVNTPRPSDLILVLAGESDHRPALALNLLNRGLGRRVLIDVPADAKVFGFSQMELAEKYVRALPMPASVGLCPIQGLSTRDESRDVKKCLTPQDSQILIVTSDFHTRRALNIFRHELPDKSFSVAASYDSAQFGTKWWTHRQWAKTCTEEWLRTFWWFGVERWQ